MELAAAAAAAVQSEEVAAAPAARQGESMADESVGVPVEAFAAVERQLNALIEGGEDDQASLREEDSCVDASHCSRYCLQASTWWQGDILVLFSLQLSTDRNTGHAQSNCRGYRHQLSCCGG